MQNALAARYVGINLGQPGLTMLQAGCGLFYENNWAEFTAGSNVQLMLGVNDLNWGPQTPEHFRICLDNLVEKVLADDPLRFVLVPPAPTLYDVTNPNPENTLYQYRLEALDKCSNDPRILCGPDPWLYFTVEDFNQGTPVHWNQHGQDKWAAIIEDYWSSH